MIDINLIPASLRKDGEANANAVKINISQEILLGVCSVLILIMVAVHIALGAVWLSGMSHLYYHTNQWQRILPDKTLMDSMSKESADLKKKIKLVSEITTKKLVLWAPKFNAISDDLPKGLWIRKMTLEKGALTIEGSVISKNQTEINYVGQFLTALKQNDNFMKDFSSLLENSTEGAKNNAVEVTDFTVMAKLLNDPDIAPEPIPSHSKKGNTQV